MNQVIVGDCRNLEKQIPNESVDLIFTDPPYLKEYLWAYDWLRDFALRCLKPNGFLLCYCGGYWKDEIMQKLRCKLTYFWDFALVHSGNSSILWQRKIISRWKSILAYHKPNSKPVPRFNVLSLWNGSGEDKRFHKWQQDASTARYYIDCFSSPDGFVVDPFAGSGTTVIVCKLLKRDCTSFEIDPETATQAQRRLENIEFEPEMQQLCLELV